MVLSSLAVVHCAATVSHTHGGAPERLPRNAHPSHHHSLVDLNYLHLSIYMSSKRTSLLDGLC